MRKSMIWISLATVTAVAAILVFVRSERSASAQAISLDRSLVALMPPDATSLAGVDLERLKLTSLYRHFEEQSRKGDHSELDDFTAETGFDPRRDVQELLIASLGGTGSESDYVVLARGQFNVAGLTGALKRKKAVVENYRSLELFGPERRADRSENGRFTFLDDRTVLAGTRPAVLAAIDRKFSGGPSLLNNTSLLSRAQTISSANQIWAVSDTPGKVISRALPRGDAQASNFARIFSSMQNTTFALDLMNGLDLRAAGICKTPQDARTLADAARGVVAFGRLSASQKEPELMNLFDNIQVEDRNSELNLSVRIDAQNLEKLLEKSRSRKTVSATL